MRTLTYGAACTLDGYIAGLNEELDWLKWSKDAARLSTSYMSRVDTILMGRRTYEAGLRQGGGFQKGFRNFVFSRTWSESPDPHVKLINRDAAEFVAELKREPGAEICLMGVGELARALFEADLVDRIGVNIHPTILGQGVPLIPEMTHRVELRLLETERISGDCLYAVYEVLRPRSPSA